MTKRYRVLVSRSEEQFIVYCKTMNRARRTAYQYKMMGYHTQIQINNKKEN